MGRPLVLIFLGTVVYGGVTVALGLLVYVSRLLREAIDGQIGPASFDPASLRVPEWAALWFHVAFLYFIALVTCGTIYLALSIPRSTKAPRPDRPAPWGPGRRSIAVVIPAYNEAPAIAQVVEDFRHHPDVDAVVVFDNHSSDRTGEIARAHGADVLREERPGFGWGHSCILGLRAAMERTKADIIVLTEADRTYFGEDVAKLLPYLHDADLAVGTRGTWYYTDPDSQMDWFLTWGNKFLALLTRLRFWDPVFFGQLQLSDVGCTLRAVRREALERILPLLTDEWAPFTLYMLIVAVTHGVSVVEVPVRFRKRIGDSKMAGASRARAARFGLQFIWYIIAK